MVKKLRWLTPGRLIVLGFICVITVGTILLSLPISKTGNNNFGFIDAVFTSTSAVCVTGLSTIDAGNDLSMFGQFVMMILMQIGGLGITTIGVGVIYLTGARISRKESALIKEALNYPNLKGIIPLLKGLLLMTGICELVGVIGSYFSFAKDYSTGKAIWISVFHSIASFNNAGFDILGHGDSMCYYHDDVILNITTCFLIIAGGFGFFVVTDIINKHKFKKFTFHTKVVLLMTGILVFGGTIVFKITEGSDMSIMEAFFASVTARTAGFATYPCSDMSNAGLIIMMILMFIGANPGSTGGGMKTTTFYVLIKSVIATAKGKDPQGFKKKIPEEVVNKAFVIISLGMFVVIVIATILSIIEPEMNMRDILFETVSAVGTAGLSTGITASFSTLSKIFVIMTMFTGRLGPMTIATLWVLPKMVSISRPEEDLPVG